MDSDCLRLQGTAEVLRRGVVAAFRKVAFSLCRAALTAKNEASF